MNDSQRQSTVIASQSVELLSNSSTYTHKSKFAKKTKQIQHNLSAGKMPKEERMRIQKEKNREAAQRSRDQHKEYVSNLERQLKYLKQEIQNNKQFCSKCRQELNSNRFFDQCLPKEEIFDEPILFAESQEREEHAEQTLPGMGEDMAEYFLRPKEAEEDYSYIKMMLFVSMIVLSVIILPATPSQSSRNLVELYSTSASTNNDDFSIAITEGIQSKSRPDPESSGLVIRNSQVNQKCLDSLLEERSLASANLRIGHPLDYESDGGVLLCSYEHSRQRAARHLSQQKSTLLKLFLLGAEINEMLTANTPFNNFITSSIQQNGIYRVGAEIKEVELISQHHCFI